VDDPEAQAAFLEALRLSWLAVWRARDYSFFGFLRRAKERNWSEDLINSLQMAGVQARHFHEKVEWLPAHYPIFGKNGDRLPGVGRPPLNTYWRGRHHEILEGTMVASPDQLAGRPKAWLSWSWIDVALPSQDGGWKLVDCFCAKNDGPISCRNRKIPSLSHTVFLEEMTLIDFNDETLKSVDGARFERGLRLSQGTFGGRVALPNVETRPVLSLTEISCSQFSLRGTKGLTGLRWKGLGGPVELDLVAERPVAVDLEGSSNRRLVKSLTGVKAVLKSLKLASIEGISKVDFSEAHFTNEVSIQLDTSGSISFANARFDGPVVISGSLQGPLTDFKGAKFGREAVFRGAHLHGSNFERVEFLQTANFDGTVFSGGADFRNARFGGPARFAGVEPNPQFTAVSFDYV
jgi:uncharacterized protein YjbI with pentapeptide repeats